MKASDLLIDPDALIRNAPDVEQMSDLERRLRGYGMTTARFFYRFPDFPNVLNEFVWQFHDLAPDHPTLFQKIGFWQREIEGKLHSVAFVHTRELRPGNWHRQVGEFAVH